MLRITALYAGLLLALFLLLTFRVFGARMRSGVMLGHGADRALERAARVHANFAEYAPIFLVALALAELCGAPGPAVHALGASMLLGRVLHAIGMSREPDIRALRGAGMLFTLIGLFGAAALALGAGLGLW